MALLGLPRDWSLGTSLCTRVLASLFTYVGSPFHLCELLFPSAMVKKKKAYSTQVRGCWTWNQCLKTFAISGHSVSTMFSKSHPMIQMTIPGSCFNYSWFFFFSFLSHARFSLKLYIKTLPPFTQGHPIIKFYLGFWRELEHLSKKKRFGGFGFLLLQPI